MAIAAVELSVQRQLTSAFIDADYVDVVLYRSGQVSDGAGGFIPGDPVPLASQKVRIITQGSTGADSKARFTADGQQVSPDYVLMGTYDADVERWDIFFLDGREYEVVFVNQNRQYEVKAEVVYRGE